MPADEVLEEWPVLNVTCSYVGLELNSSPHVITEVVVGQRA